MNQDIGDVVIAYSTNETTKHHDQRWKKIEVLNVIYSTYKRKNVRRPKKRQMDGYLETEPTSPNLRTKEEKQKHYSLQSSFINLLVYCCMQLPIQYIVRNLKIAIDNLLPIILKIIHSVINIISIYFIKNWSADLSTIYESHFI